MGRLQSKFAVLLNISSQTAAPQPWRESFTPHRHHGIAEQTANLAALARRSELGEIVGE
jgi:hypothetical protein